MNREIRNKLREELGVNSVGVKITRPDQVLIIMRGISGSGKSTKAKQVVGNGVIHSTDDVLSSMGDYREIFNKMISTGNFSDLSKAHNTNLKNAVGSMKAGVTPVVIDNTNIKANEPKAYVKAALELGYADSNIQFEDVGTGGASAEELAARNSHGVPLEKILQMMASHKGVGDLDVNKVMSAKDFNKPSDVLYSAVVLAEHSKSELLNIMRDMIPKGWTTFAHHMTIVFGKGLPDNLKGDLGKEVTLKVTEFGHSDMAIAVKVDGYPSTNDIPHITVAVNTESGGKPYDSNKIENWDGLDDYINLTGVVTEVKR